jgi:hypothetical protein
MLRIPIPVALAVLIAFSAVTVYFYVTVVQNPTRVAWTDQGNATVYTYVVPEGGWVVLGAFSGTTISIASNATFDIRYDAVSAVAFANDYLPEGYYRIFELSLNVQPGGYISLDNAQLGWCISGSVARLPNGMVMYYPNYTAVGADCGCVWPPAVFTIDDYGWLSVSGCASLGHYGANGVVSYVINSPVYRQTYVIGPRTYYLYLRHVYVIWVRPHANAAITVTVIP